MLLAFTLMCRSSSLKSTVAGGSREAALKPWCGGRRDRGGGGGGRAGREIEACLELHLGEVGK